MGKGLTQIALVLTVCMLLIVLVHSRTDRLLSAPILEVGELWMDSARGYALWVCHLLMNPTSMYSMLAYLGCIIVMVVLYYLYCALFVPMERIKLLGDIGYIEESTFSKKEIANMVRKRRLVGDVPPVYPNGWFGLIEGFRLKKGHSTNISVLGLNLAVFRDDSGNAHVLDAYCPHMGANLAVGGRVLGDCIECPFHGWQFRGSDGKCTKIPNSDKIPDIARVKRYTTCEKNGWIYLWFHAEGVDPTWELPDLPEVNSGEWKFAGRTEHYINCHIEEVPENGGDVQHLLYVHTPFMSSGVDLRYMWSKFWSFGSSHVWDAKWEPLPPPDAHIGCLQLKHSLKLFEKQITLLDMDVVARQIGPGVVYLTFDTIFGKGVYIISQTPTEPLVQKMVHNIYVSRYTPLFMGKFFMYSESVQLERDIMIWNNKRWQGKPMFVRSKEDALISRHRRWYSQFYSENSPRLSFQKESLDW
ncbi:hypothetical protein FSP39_009231 [Pinctada imbricata]|uniref:cholesterol 7-desaturase n=1 Tax=Pinctada imbricata TaxID=66713 RepID=A0AA88XLQ9_PINIB|nr:hypothetical protein FSP39_009231 [Pinctada imbricata]